MHAISASSYRFDHVSPSAFALAVLLHGAVAFALWWMTQNASRPAPLENAIEVTIEQPPPLPAPESPKPEPPKPRAQVLPPPILEGLPPPGIESDRRGQVPGSKEQPRNVEDAEPAAEIALAKPAPPEPPAPQQPQPPKPTRPPEHKVAPLAPAPAPHPSTRPAPPAPPVHSPLAARRQAPPPVANPGSSSTSPFVNPADTYNRARASDNYLWEIVRRLSGYRYHANVAVRQGVTVVRVIIARDGQLLDVGIVRSSGYPELDAGVVAGIRRGAPYSPLPSTIAGDRASFDLPLVSAQR